MKANVQVQMEAWTDLASVPVMNDIRNAGVNIEFKRIKDQTAIFECSGNKDQLSSDEIRAIKFACDFDLEFERATYSDTKTAVGKVKTLLPGVAGVAINHPVFHSIEIQFRIVNYLQCETIKAPESSIVTEDQMELLKKKFINGEVTLETCSYDIKELSRCQTNGCADIASVHGHCYAHNNQMQDELADREKTEKINRVAEATAESTF